MTDKERARRNARYEDARKGYDALMKFYPFTLENLDGEQWRDIIGYDGYQESNFGRTKSFKYKTPRIIKPVLSSMGYLAVCLSNGNKKKNFLVHQLVAATFIPNTDGKPQVNHADGHPLNCHISNLEWATSKENNQHASRTGLTPSGEDNYRAALTNEQAAWCCEVYIPNDPVFGTSALARMFAVTPQAMSYIVHGTTYKNACGKINETRHKAQQIPYEVQQEIRRLYKKGVRGHGTPSLGKMFGVGREAIRRIVNEK